MQVLLLTVVFLAALTFSVAVPTLVLTVEDGQEYHLTPVLSRQTRETPQIFGQGGATGHKQGGFVGVDNPNGSGGSVGYGHQNGFGHTVSVDGRVPVWSNKNRYGESTLNIGAGATHHFGGPGGSQNLDKRGTINFNHRW